MYVHIFKRFFDFIVSMMCIPFLLLITLLLAPIIWFEDKGNPFYCSERLGKNGKTFNMLKFRSMKVNAPDLRTNDNETFNSEDDFRLTKIGKVIRRFSIDETPQIVNVLIGDMSLIGPRPNLDDRGGHVFTADETRRLDARPGITGYNQAYFRNSITKEEKFKNDVYYVEHLSFMMDVRVLFKTVMTIFKKNNVYNDKSIK